MSAFSIIDAAGGPRLVASRKIDADREFETVAGALTAAGSRRLAARKIAFVAARRVTATARVETRFNGKETHNSAAPGDYVVTNLDPARNVLRDREGAANTYVVRADAFGRLYERDQGGTAFGDIYKAMGVVDAVEVAGGFDIVAPWGERQTGEAGYLVRNGADVYGIHRDAFLATYEAVG